jgi:hypothetical protein
VKLVVEILGAALIVVVTRCEESRLGGLRKSDAENSVLR